MLKKVNKILELLLKIVAATLLFGLFLIVFGQVILRYFFNTGFKWNDGVSVMGFIWLAMVGSALGVRSNTLARVTLIEDKFKNGEFFFWVQKISQILFFGALLYASILFTKQAGSAIYQLLKIPYSVQYVSSIVFCVCGIAFMIEEIMDKIKKEKEEQA